MKFKLVLASLGVLIYTLPSMAQTAEDALRFSQNTINGTARIQGLAGAQTALGADISSLSGNPAGLGLFRKSEWSISPGLGFANTKSSYINNSINDSKANFNIANLGIVLSGAKDDIVGGNWRGGSFGISFSRINNFHNRFSYEGVNETSSLIDNLWEKAQGIPLRDFSSEVASALPLLAYQGFMINPVTTDPNETRYRNDVLFEGDPVQQSETVTTRGAQYQWNLGYGGNYADKLFFGASLGISRISYGEKRQYEELVLLDPEYLILDNFKLTEDVEVKGTGINLSLGLIYKVTDALRFGASFQTPTFYKLRDYYTPSILVNYDSLPSLPSFDDASYSIEESIVYDSPLEYNLTTPLKASAGIAFFAGKNGFITAEIDYLSYKGMQLDSKDIDFKITNRYIQNSFQQAINVKVGGEYRKDVYRLRGGIAYMGEPYNSSFDDFNRARLNFSVGAGIRLPEFFIDLAVVHTRFNSGMTPYEVAFTTVPSVTTKNNLTNAVLTFGTFF